MERESDELVGLLPIHLTNALSPNIHIHQFPVLNRPLQVPPSAALSGKRIQARVKPKTGRVEVHVPADTRPEVWSSEKAKELGVAEVRMQSEKIPHKGVYVLGVVREG